MTLPDHQFIVWRTPKRRENRESLRVIAHIVLAKNATEAIRVSRSLCGDMDPDKLYTKPRAEHLMNGAIYRF